MPIKTNSLPDVLEDLIPPSNYRVFLSQCRLLYNLYGQLIARQYFEKYIDNYKL